MRVLITGAGGFIGSHLVEDQLRRGYQVTAVDLNLDGLRLLELDGRIRQLEMDFRDAENLDPNLPGHDICYHLASAHLETGAGSDYYFRTNVEGARDFVRRCYEAGIERFVHCSSVGVHGTIRHPPADESYPLRPENIYEQTKLEGERAVSAYGQAAGYPVVVVRPAWVYGSRCPRTEKLIRAVRDGRFFLVGSGQALRHPIYIEDMVLGFEVAGLHPGAPGHTFIMAGPRAVTIQELIGEIARCLGVAAPRARAPKALVWPAVFALELLSRATGRQAPFTRRSLKFFTGNTAFDTSKAAEQLQFQAAIDIQEGFQKMLAEAEDLSALPAAAPDRV